MRFLLRDLRFGVRTLTKTPLLTLAVLLTLAIGIGANSAVFTVANAVLLRPFPFPAPEQIVSITSRDAAKENGGTLLRYELVRDYNKSFQSVAVWTNDNLNLTGNGEPTEVPIARISPSMLPMLDVLPQLGRVFTQDEGTPAGRPVAILSNAIWRTRYHADPGIVGSVVTLDSIATTVVGVLPANARFPFMPKADIFTPRYFELSLMTPQRLRMGVGYLNMIARLRPATDIFEANNELTLLNQRYREQNPTAPDAAPSTQMKATSLRDEVVGDVRPKVLILSGAVVVVLLIACANVASLLLSRALARKREIATRAALGASRSVIVRQLLTESLLLALVAGTLGVGIGWAATRALAVWGASQIPEGFPLTLDGQVLLFSVAISFLTGIAFGIFPALQLARVDLNATLRSEGRTASISRSGSRGKALLVVIQIALSLVLLIAAGLLLRSFSLLLRVDPGFEAHNLLTMDVSLSTTKYAKPDQQIAFFNDVLQRISAQPGIRSAAISATLPLTFKRITPVLADGQPDVPLAQRPFVDIEAISPRWFETMRVPLRSGRTFASDDNAKAPPVVIVNETFARQYWPGQSAVGKRVVVGRRPEPALVVGVAADVKNQGLQKDSLAQLYLPFEQLPWSDMNLLVRTDVRPTDAVAAIRAQIAAVDGNQPVNEIQTAEELVDGSRAQPRFVMLLVGGFSATALLLAIVGVYGVLSYSVGQRRQEFGIRLALGANRANILQMVMRQGLFMVLGGITTGLCAALMLTRFLENVLYKTTSRDLTTFVLVPALFLLVAVFATYLPARRAMKVEPAETLR
ncbi:ABC transporter permease [Telmatobacter sp. DSM 110680]|uniref:ABC transporter permease n=1 Tax=Telmatobacter sp. DSM 110680 TaxID=3036704 RepID=A0AAU7DKA8_9BACT